MGGEDPLGVADVNRAVSTRCCRTPRTARCRLDSSQLGNGQLPPLVTVGSQLQHHSIFGGLHVSFARLPHPWDPSTALPPPNLRCGRTRRLLLCQNTQLTFTQVSLVANARRRMKKSNVDDDKTSDDSATESPKGSSPQQRPLHSARVLTPAPPRPEKQSLSTPIAILSYPFSLFKRFHIPETQT
eukprot:Em0019g912a